MTQSCTIVPGLARRRSSVTVSAALVAMATHVVALVTMATHAVALVTMATHAVALVTHARRCMVGHGGRTDTAAPATRFTCNNGCVITCARLL